MFFDSGFIIYFLTHKLRANDGCFVLGDLENMFDVSHSTIAFDPKLLIDVLQIF